MRFIILLLSLLFYMPLFAENESADQDSIKNKNQSLGIILPRPKSMPKLRMIFPSATLPRQDSQLEMPLYSDSICVVPFKPSPLVQRNDFEKKMGILPTPDPEKVELNGLIFKGDPTVDLGMIYPKETRDKIVREKYQKHFKGKNIPRFRVEPLK